jgi:Raf kinase inhibitor-like YbhB/YbcL family protein
MKILVTSPAFDAGEPIPARHTADGPDVSPPLQWSGVPGRARTLVLICDDPDAPMGSWAHWVLFNLPAHVTGLPENVLPAGNAPQGARQGVNDFGHVGYGGPAPPTGRPHRYSFKLSALDTELSLPAGACRKDVLQAMEGHVVGEGQLVGTYQRVR